MSNIRRVYTYVVCTISLQAVVWAVIALLRNLFVFGVDPVAVAFQVALIVVGTPLFLGHWLWSRRSVEESVEERGAVLRRVYLYGNMAGFLGPFLANAFDLIRMLLGGENALQSSSYLRLYSSQAVVYHMIAMLVLAVLWFYHQRIVAEDNKVIPLSGGSATVRRLYVLGFSSAGLTMTITAVILLVRSILLELDTSVITHGGLSIVLTDEIPRLLIGLPLWLIFWRRAQSLFAGPDEEERNSALRKLFLYAAVFIGALGTVANAAGILAGVFRLLLGVSSGEGDIRQPLSAVVGMGILWIFHAFVLRDDTLTAGEAPRAAGVRRLHVYLVAAVGLAALLVGLSGDISVILRSFETTFGTALRVEFSWFTAAIIAGLPVWIIPWRQAQGTAVAADAEGAQERRSVVRKIYLYFFLFLATITILSSAVYIVFRILQAFLGEDPPSLTELGHAISFTTIAAAVWLYHGQALRGDGKTTRREQAGLLKEMRVVVVDAGGESIGQRVVEELMRDYPGISLDAIVLPSKKPKAAEAAAAQKDVITKLARAGLIVGPWMIAVAGGAGGAVSAKVANAVISSPARKILMPTHSDGWDWAGVDRWDSEGIIHQAVRAVKQVLAGEEITARRPMGGCAIAAIVIGALIVLSLLAIPLLLYFTY